MTATKRVTEQAAGTLAPPHEPPPHDRPEGEAAVPQPAQASGTAARPPPSGLPYLMTLLGAIVAPTTLLTSLLFYFGWSHAYWFFDYFAVNSTLLGLTTQDYLMRSLDGLFVPMIAAACVGLLVLWGHAVLRARLIAGYRLRPLLPVMAIGGLALAVTGLWSVFTTTMLDDYLAMAPLMLASGVLLLVYAVRLRRSLTTPEVKSDHALEPEWRVVAEWAGIFVIVGLSLFWAASDYSSAVGRSRAQQFEAELPTYPSAVVFSDQSLSLDAPGVREVRCQDPDANYRFRYDGLKLVLQSGDQYLFLPEAWSRTDGVAIVIPRNDSLRLEFVPASAGAARRSTC